MERWTGLFARFTQLRQRTVDEAPVDVRPAKGIEDAEMTPYDIRSRSFATRRFGGFEPEEVMAFLDEAAEALYSAQRRYIEQGAQVRLLEREVKALTIKQAPAAQAASTARQDEQKDETSAAGRLEILRSTALQEVEALLHDAQGRAQALTDEAHERAATILREADALKSNRQKEAEQLVAEATVTAESILMTAREQEVSLRHELDLLAESRLRMLDDVWATLNGCQEWLTMVDPRRRGAEEQHGGLDRVA